MKIIKPSFEILPEVKPSDVLKRIESIGRTCYKSESQITDSSAEDFVRMLIRRGHESVLEHGHVIIRLSKWHYWNLEESNLKYFNLTETHTSDSERYIISANIRAIRDAVKEDKTCSLHEVASYLSKKYPVVFDEYKWRDEVNDIMLLDPSDLRTKEEIIAHQTMSVRFIIDRGVSHEVVRHRPASFSQESTRYINYTKENKGGECAFVSLQEHLSNPFVSLEIWLKHMEACEEAYKAMIDAGETPQIARSVLPNSLKTEIVVTANLEEWREIFKQRVSVAAHPQMREIMRPLLDECKQLYPTIFSDINY